MADFTFRDSQPAAVSAPSKWFNHLLGRGDLQFSDHQPAVVAATLNASVTRASLAFRNWIVIAGDTQISPKPIIGNFEPIAGTAISRFQYISFDVTDEMNGLAAVFVTAMFGDGNCECVFDGAAFTPRYAAGSAISVIPSGMHFIVRRAGGWYTTPLRIDVVAINNDANVSTTKVGF